MRRRVHGEVCLQEAAEAGHIVNKIDKSNRVRFTAGDVPPAEDFHPNADKSRATTRILRTGLLGVSGETEGGYGVRGIP